MGAISAAQASLRDILDHLRVGAWEHDALPGYHQGVLQALTRLAIVLIVAVSTAVTTFVIVWFYYRPTLEYADGRGPIRVSLYPLGWVTVAVLSLAWLGVVYWIVSPVIRSR
jgi:hypothetical protein